MSLKSYYVLFVYLHVGFRDFSNYKNKINLTRIESFISLNRPLDDQWSPYSQRRRENGQFLTFHCFPNKPIRNGIFKSQGISVKGLNENIRSLLNEKNHKVAILPAPLLGTSITIELTNRVLMLFAISFFSTILREKITVSLER